jgi:6,7-dimethyl-8-ribityllumazine synthase
MMKYGAKRENIVIESIPGSYELPIACSRCATPFHAAIVNRVSQGHRRLT